MSVWKFYMNVRVNVSIDVVINYFEIVDIRYIFGIVVCKRG